jgi:hypothetical protein
MWQSGFRHVFDQSGFIRHSTNCFNVVPNNTFDDTLRFAVGSFWTLDDGTTYKCIDNTTGAAVWELYSSPAPKYKVYTALLTQSGDDNSITLGSGDSVIKGITYRISGGSDGDFSNVGAPNNNETTSFVATINGLPNNYRSCVLIYNVAAPIVTVLENTIGNIYFDYAGPGLYACKSPSLFTLEKTIIDMDAYCQNGNPAANLIYRDLGVSSFIIGTNKGDFGNGYLSNNRLEIKVYN